jgi:hypothetical protein
MGGKNQTLNGVRGWAVTYVKYKEIRNMNTWLDKETHELAAKEIFV